MNAPLYPIDAFPPVMRKAVLEVHHSVQAALPLCAASALTTLAAAAQKWVKVRMPWGGESKPVGVYSMVIAESGDRKTAVDERFRRPLEQRDLKIREAHATADGRYQTDNRLWAQIERKLIGQISAEERGSAFENELRVQLDEHIAKKPIKPKLSRLLHQDVTERAILDALEGTGRSIALLCDEGDTLLRSGVLRSPGLLNKAWDGGPLYCDRKDRQMVAFDTRVTVSIMVQRAVLKDYLGRRGDVVRGSGMLARFLMCQPPSMQGWRQVGDFEQASEHMDMFKTRIEEILNGDADMVYEFDDDAKLVFSTLSNQIEETIRPLGGDFTEIRDFVSKASENIARIAALFHHFSAQPGSITVDTLCRAEAIVAWHMRETKKIFAPDFDVPQVLVDANALEGYLRTRFRLFGNLATFVPKNEILRNGPIRPAARFNSALECLIYQGKVWIGVTKQRQHLINIGQNWV